MQWFYLAWGLILFQRLSELWLARQNGKWITERGGYEVGKEHYKWIVGLHACFFLSLFAEYRLLSPSPPEWWPVPFAFFVAAQILRMWAIASLGRHWNTRIFILPGASPVRKGPYRWIRHPNYLVVMVELLTFPLVFGLYFTSAFFSLLNLPVIWIRISVEEQALEEATSYGHVMKKVPYFLPIGRKNR